MTQKPSGHYHVESQRNAIAALCRKYGVAALDLFGSATTDEWQPTSDLDFIVTFKRHSIRGLADRYLRLAEELEKRFGRTVHLITPGAIRNPYFKRSVDASRASVYAEYSAQALVQHGLGWGGDSHILRRPNAE
ncbi:MAG: nucleotidyltransferase family protein [Gemmatimonadaceae bacterium]